MHTLAFLDPGHFHATLTLRERCAAVSPEVFVYAPAGPELDDFLALIDRFNRRAERPTAWRPRVRLSADPLARLLAERPGDLVVLAGRTGGKARGIEALHAAGLHVLADKPWLVAPGDLAAIRASLAGGALVREMMTGRRDPVGRLVKRLVDDPALFGGFDAGAAPAIEQEGVHHFEKRVDGVPLRRPWWYFDSRVQGGGAVDIPTHLVDQAQWWLDGAADAPRLLSARGWSTRVPLDVFARVSGAPAVPPALAHAVEGGALRVFSNAELVSVAHGFIVGNAFNGDPTTLVSLTGFRWAPSSGWTPLDRGSFVRDVNASGSAVGAAPGPAIWLNGSNTATSIPDGVLAMAINDSSVVAGDFLPGNVPFFVAGIWTQADGWTMIGNEQIPTVMDINNSRQVVGYWHDQGEDFAEIWQP